MKKMVVVFSVALVFMLSSIERQCSKLGSGVFRKAEEKAANGVIKAERVAAANVVTAAELGARSEQRAISDLRWKELTILSVRGRFYKSIKDIVGSQGDTVVVEGGVRGVVVVPRNEVEFRNIFGTDPKMSQLSNLRKVQNDIFGIKGVKLAPSIGEEITDGIVNSPGKFFIITGHNNNGKLFLPNGSSVLFSDIKYKCAVYGKYCIFLSCSSKKWVGEGEGVGVGRDLTYEDSIEFMKAIESYYDYALRNSLTNSQVAETIPLIVESIALSQKIQVGMRVSSITGGVGFVLIVRNERDK